MSEKWRLPPQIDDPDTPHLVNIALRAVNHAGARTEARIRHLEAATDEPLAKGGEDRSPTPLETVVLALVGCEGVIVRAVARAMRFSLERVEFDCRAVTDLRGARGVAGVRPHFEKAALIIRVFSEEDEAAFERLQRNVESRCPVLNLLRDAGVAVTIDWQLVRPEQPPQ